MYVRFCLDACPKPGLLCTLTLDGAIRAMLIYCTLVRGGITLKPRRQRRSEGDSVTRLIPLRTVDSREGYIHQAKFTFTTWARFLRIRFCADEFTPSMPLFQYGAPFAFRAMSDRAVKPDLYVTILVLDIPFQDDHARTKRRLSPA